MGMLESTDAAWMATSLDGIVEIRPVNEVDVLIQFPLEIKTRVVPNTVSQLVHLVSDHGRFKEITVVLDDEENKQCFCKVIPHLHDRMQLLHHVTVTNETKIIYCESSIDCIERVVIVTFDRRLISCYKESMMIFKDCCLGFIYNHRGLVPDVPQEEYGYCGDKRTLLLDLALCRGLREKVNADNTPLPHCHKIIPSLVSAWNRCKVGVDTHSRFISTATYPFKVINAGAMLWELPIFTMALMAYLVGKWYDMGTHADNPRCTSITELRNRAKNKAGPFKLSLHCMHKQFRKMAQRVQPDPIMEILNADGDAVAGAPVQPPFVVPCSKGKSTLRKRTRAEAFNTVEGYQHRQRCTAADWIDSETRVLCFMCKQKCAKVCRNCGEHLDSMECFTRFHDLRKLLEE
jgi:hypothetical protein